MADFTGRRANLIYFAVIALAVIGMCWNPSHLATAVTDDDYDVYRAYLAAHPPPPGHALVVPGQTDAAASCSAPASRRATTTCCGS